MKSTLLDELLQRLPDLASSRPVIEHVFERMHQGFKSGGKLLLCGNGGSAADADHWAGELLKGFRHTRPLDLAPNDPLAPQIATRLQRALPAIPLTGFPALTTAFANDVDPELTFAQLTWALGAPGDLWVGLSTSGNARNVCAAAEVARARKMIVIGLTGETGGLLAPLCDLVIRAPVRETYRVQEYHLPIYHCLSLMLEEAFFITPPDPTKLAWTGSE